MDALQSQIQAVARAKWATMALGSIVAEGDLDALDKALRDGAHPASSHCPVDLLSVAVSRGGPGGERRVAMLLRAGAPMPQGIDQAKLIHRAAAFGRSGCLKLLLDAGANLKAAPDMAAWALSAACQRGHHDCAALLLAAGADPNAAREPVMSPLKRAALSGSLACARLLVGAGADLDETDALGKTALDHALETRHAELARFLDGAAKARAERVEIAQGVRLGAALDATERDGRRGRL
jgi:ankyrin repeat protein